MNESRTKYIITFGVNKKKNIKKKRKKRKNKQNLPAL